MVLGVVGLDNALLKAVSEAAVEDAGDLDDDVLSDFMLDDFEQCLHNRMSQYQLDILAVLDRSQMCQACPRL